MADKKCVMCGGLFDATTQYFPARKDSKCELRNTCITCTSIFRHNHYTENQKKILENKRQDYCDKRELYKIRNTTNYQKHKINKLEYCKQYYLDHREEKTQYSRVYAAKNAERFRPIRRLITQRYKARKRCLPSSLSNKEWDDAKQYFGNECAYCGQQGPLTQDHFIPANKCGGYMADNIIPACPRCNSSKRDNSFAEWYFRQTFHNSAAEAKILHYLTLVKTIA